MMKKAFTLVELLVVVVVIAILASITFKIAGIGTDLQQRNTTIARMQKLENAISGYFAAFGSYPPVSLQGRSRNIYYKVNNGIQQVGDDHNASVDTSEVVWERVEAACRSQPVSIRFPFATDDLGGNANSYMAQVSSYAIAQGKLTQAFDALKSPASILNNSSKKTSDWTQCQLFQFGLLSYLLPRYLVMMGYQSESTAGEALTLYQHPQWSDNNSIPCRFEDGLPFESWAKVNNEANSDASSEKWKIAALPSQAVTARWMPNLSGILRAYGKNIKKLYGVNVNEIQTDDTSYSISMNSLPAAGDIFSYGNSQSGEGSSSGYILNKITCNDGWGYEFYYYSPPPYQSYRLWSAGENHMTFPPWIPAEEIENMREKNTIRNWMADDIVHLSN